jgi:hypothetical protein
MSQQRQALTLSIAFSLPLLVWLFARLEFIEWDADSLQFVFRRTLAGLLLLQLLATALLFINSSGENWRDDALGIVHIVLFPLPLLVLIWLTGSVSPYTILKALSLVSSFGLLAFLTRQIVKPVCGGSNISEIGHTLAHILFAVMVWNFRELWWGWLEL